MHDYKQSLDIIKIPTRLLYDDCFHVILCDVRTKYVMRCTFSLNLDIMHLIYKLNILLNRAYAHHKTHEDVYI